MRIYKYRGGNKDVLKRDLRSLCVNEIYSAPLHSLNDVFEAGFIIDKNHFTLSEMILGIKEKDLEELNQSTFNILREYADELSQFGVYSLSKTFNDELLWAYYADSHRGFCLEYELDELMEYRMRDELVIHVDYKTNMPYITDIDLLHFHDKNHMVGDLNKKMIGTKSVRWSHEDETRIVTGRPGLYKYKPDSLKAIYFGCRSDPKFIKLVMRLLCGRGLKYYKISMENETYTLKRNRLEDAYEGRRFYKTHFATIEDGVPYICESNEKYSEYINKAIEIVRRQYDCKHVINADISVNKGMPSNPVIYVQYYSVDERMQKEHFTLKKINESSI